MTARLEDPSTSHVARPTASARRAVRDRILVEHQHRPQQGLTDAELCALMPHVTPGSLVKRRGELVADGLLVDSGDRRPVKRTGRAAIVWRLVP